MVSIVLRRVIVPGLATQGFSITPPPPTPDTGPQKPGKSKLKLIITKLQIMLDDNQHAITVNSTV